MELTKICTNRHTTENNTTLAARVVFSEKETICERVRQDEGCKNNLGEGHKVLNMDGAELEVRWYASVWYTGTLVRLKSYRYFFLADCHTSKPLNSC